MDTACVIDLHAHTRASDGSDTPAQLLAQAAAVGISVLAVTDHDTVEAVAESQELGRSLGVEVLPGCEISATCANMVVHVLAYGPGLLEPATARTLVQYRDERMHRNEQLGARLHALTGVGLPDALAIAGPSRLSRAHFARALVSAGVVASIPEAFEHWLGPHAPAYVASPAMSIEATVRLVHATGGVLVLAHPGRIEAAARDRIVATAVAAGVDGLEVWHSEHAPEEQARWARHAKQGGLLATGGSDYHGLHKPGVHLGTGRDGNVAVPPPALAALRACLAALAP